MQIGIIPRTKLTPGKCKQLGAAIVALTGCDVLRRPELLPHDQMAVERLRSGRLPDPLAIQLGMDAPEYAYYKALEKLPGDDVRWDERFGPDSRSICLSIPELCDVDYAEVAQTIRDHIPESLVDDVLLDYELSWTQV